MNEHVLDSSIVKDLSSNIYEKRKATAFQVEGIVKSALSRNDGVTVRKIIEELTELTYGGTNSAKMGAITALGSVSVALGSFAIAFFLESIVKPIFASFRDTDARIRYYACESLYNIAKIARGEILLYFNEIFDVLCVLVTDTESSVRNAADILDRLIKDIVSAKSTHYVSVLRERDNSVYSNENSNDIPSYVVEPSGYAVQVNHIQDTRKAFSLPKFIPTLLERMYVIDPFAKKFIIGWLELLDDVPTLELITFLPNLLGPLINFFFNSAPSDVRVETHNILNTFLKEITAISNVKLEAKKQNLRQQLQQRKEAEYKKLEGKENEPQENNEEEENEYSHDTSRVASSKLSINSESTTVIKSQVKDKEDTRDDSSFYNGEILSNLQEVFIDYSKITDTLLSFLKPSESNGKAFDYKLGSTLDEDHGVLLEVQFTVLQWLQTILKISPTTIIRHLPDCVSLIVKNISLTEANKDSSLRNELLNFNLLLRKILFNLNEASSREVNFSENGETIASESGKNEFLNEEGISDLVDDNVLLGLNKEAYDEYVEVYLGQTLEVIMNEFVAFTNEVSRVTLLDWIIFLYSLNPAAFFKRTDSWKSHMIIDTSVLFKASMDANNEVVMKILELLSNISEAHKDFFRDLIIEFIDLCEKYMVDESEDGEKRNEPYLARAKAEFIIRKLCQNLSSEKIYTTISEELMNYHKRDLEFLDSMVVTLNSILLTAPEVTAFRTKLRNIDAYKVEDWSLFATLFQFWCHNSPSALSLCFLSTNYELAYMIIKNMGELEVDYNVLVQLDILVQLLESPIFLKLRLQLLEPEKHPYLYKSLYGLLMILPQSSTFFMLKNRLSSITSSTLSSGGSTNVSSPLPAPTASQATAANSSFPTQLSIKKKRIYEMLDKFVKIQESYLENNISDMLDHNLSGLKYD